MGGIIGGEHRCEKHTDGQTDAQREMKGQLAGALPKGKWKVSLLARCPKMSFTCLITISKQFLGPNLLIVTDLFYWEKLRVTLLSFLGFIEVIFLDNAMWSIRLKNRKSNQSGYYYLFVFFRCYSFELKLALVLKFY